MNSQENRDSLNLGITDSREQTEEKPESNSQNRQPKRKRTRKDSGQERSHICPCGKTYLSYPALYTHNKNKHDGMVQLIEDTQIQSSDKQNVNISTELLQRFVSQGSGQSQQLNEGSTSPQQKELDLFNKQDVYLIFQNNSEASIENQRMTCAEVKDLLMWEVILEFFRKDNQSLGSNYVQLLLKQYRESPITLGQLAYDGKTQLSVAHTDLALVLFMMEIETQLNPEQYQIVCLFSYLLRRAVDEIYQDPSQTFEPCQYKPISDIIEISDFFFEVLVPKYLQLLQQEKRIYIDNMLQIPNLVQILTNLYYQFNKWLYSKQLTHHVLILKDQ